MPRGPYCPKPIDTGEVELPEEVGRLAERLARNTHEVWARARIADGWRHGRVRDDLRKEHPNLVPYDDLPEAEKAYDRKTVVETLKALSVMGFRIVGPRGRPRGVGRGAR